MRFLLLTAGCAGDPPTIAAPPDPPVGTDTGIPTLDTDDDVIPLVRPGPIGRTDVALVADIEMRGFRTGAEDGPQVGENVILGDFDGDGLDDLFVGASSWDNPETNQGAGFGLASSDLALCDVDPADASVECALEDVPPEFTVMITGPTMVHAHFGTQLTSGDLDGDGMDDLVVAAPGSRIVSVWYGVADMVWIPGSPDTVIKGGLDFGKGVAVVGDLNSDGCDDLAIGAHGAADSRGQVYVFCTPVAAPCGRFPAVVDLSAGDVPDILLEGPESDTFAGESVAAAGDVDGDGDDDFLIGAPNGEKEAIAKGPGEVWLVYGGTDAREIGSCAVPCVARLDAFGASGTYDGARFTLDGAPFGNSWLGNKVAGVGDATGDGCPDMLFAAMKYGGVIGNELCGSAFLVDGSGACDGGARRVSDGILLDGSGDDYAVQFIGDSFNDKLGEAISGVGDANGDGIADLLLGEYRDDEVDALETTQNGAAYLVYGGWSGFDEAAPSIVTVGTHVCEAAGTWPADIPPYLKIYGSMAGDIVAKHVAGGGDVNGDGLHDMLLGAPRWGASDMTCEEAICDKGNAYVVYGDAADLCLDQ